MKSYDLAIAYRIYPKVAKPAQGLPFTEDKLRLAEICLRSFRDSLGDLRVKVWALLDRCPQAYAGLFGKYFHEQDLVLLPLPGVGNQATFGKQLDILLAQQDSELVYFAEDDYVYLPGQFPRMLKFLLAYDDVNFISPYDHLDCYTLELHRHPKWVRVHGGHHWRTAASTCLTVLTRTETLRKTKAVFRSYCRRNDDCSLWLSLTKKSLFDPLQFVRFAVFDRHFANIIAKAWVHCWRQVLFGPQMKLWVPIPGFATHLDRNAMSPTIDWPGQMTKEAAAIGLDNGQHANCILPRATSALPR